MANYDQLRNKTRTESRHELSDVYQAARNLEVKTLTDRVLQQAGRSASADFLHEIAASIADAANKKGNQ